MHGSMADYGIDQDDFHNVARTSPTFPFRVFSRVIVTPGCWWWTGATDPHGYGILGRGVRGSGNIYAHRAVWELLMGPVTNGLVYDHLCRNPPCVSPEHGEIVTLAENMLRGYAVSTAYAKRDRCGSGHPLDGVLGVRGGREHCRYCKTCARTKSLARYHSRKAAENAQR